MRKYLETYREQQALQQENNLCPRGCQLAHLPIPAQVYGMLAQLPIPAQVYGILAQLPIPAKVYGILAQLPIPAQVYGMLAQLLIPAQVYSILGQLPIPAQVYGISSYHACTNRAHTVCIVLYVLYVSDDQTIYNPNLIN